MEQSEKVENKETEQSKGCESASIADHPEPDGVPQDQTCFDLESADDEQQRLLDMNRFSFLVLSSSQTLPETEDETFFFSTDDILLGRCYSLEFGPLNLADVCDYYCKATKTLKDHPAERKIVHFTGPDKKNIVNAAFLYGSYLIRRFRKTPEEVYQYLIDNYDDDFISFRDASKKPCTYYLTLYSCFSAVDKADKNGWFKDFDSDEYFFYSEYENGDLNWIVPRKIIAFVGPVSEETHENGCVCLPPESYFKFFRENDVTTIVRLNEKVYDASRFTDNGFEHHDLFFQDGSVPSDSIMETFLEIVENAKGVVAVHCKSGLGRTGTLIACYLMKHYHFTSDEAIAWVRICRPGSIVGPQQNWLAKKQNELWQPHITSSPLEDVRDDCKSNKRKRSEEDQLSEDVSPITAKKMI